MTDPPGIVVVGDIATHRRRAHERGWMHVVRVMLEVPAPIRNVRHDTPFHLSQVALSNRIGFHGCAWQQEYAYLQDTPYLVSSS